MLKLRSIEMIGFKSFYDRSEISVSGQAITAVVGPNGCGKSNISDAVAWVLGEQRARSLRGKSMEDVIFNGTQSRAPLGMAEVTISLVDDNPPHSNGGPPPGLIEMMVQRRLYRSGESQYLLNGRPCRLRDIQDIFMGTGLGPNSYAIIEQGRIGQILGARPTERRTLIEEAAGVTKFKAKRKLAESRLEGARRNLARVHDILVEVERQCNSLKRQASKARRFRTVKKRLRELLAGVFSTRAELLIDGQDRVSAALAGMAREGQELEEAIGELDGHVHRCRGELQDQEALLEETREKQLASQLDLEKAQQRIERAGDQVRSLDERNRELNIERDRSGRELEDRRSEIETSIRKLEEIGRDLEEVRLEFERCRDVLADLSTRRKDEERSIAEFRERQFEVVGREAQIGNEFSSRRELLRRLDAQASHVRAEEQEARDTEEGCLAKLQAAELERSTRQSEIGHLARERSETRQSLDTLRVELETGQRAADEARSREEAIRHRLETIRELSLDRAYGTESVQQFFNHIRDEEWEPVGIVADFVEVERDYEAIVEDLLPAELQYVVVQDLLHAEKSLSIVRDATRGRLDFFVLDPDRDSVYTPDAVPGAQPVADVVRLDARLHSFALRISGMYIVDDLERAWELSERHAGKTFVARSGEVVRDRLISWGERSGHGPLSLKREIRDLDRRIERARREAREATAQVGELAERVDTTEQLGHDLETRLQEAEKEALGLDHGLRALGTELERTEERLATVRSEIARFVEERGDLVAAMEAAEAETVEVAASKRAIELELKTRTANSESLREEIELEASKLTELRSGLAVLEERNESQGRDLAAVRERTAELEERHRHIEGQISGAAAQKAAALASIASDEESRERLAALRDDLARRIESAVDRLADLRKELHEAEAKWDDARSGMDSFKDKHNEREIERNQIDSDLKHLISLCHSELGESIESVCLDSFDTLNPEELAARESESQELHSKVDAMGSVNMMAVEEYDEALVRFHFLTGQRQDLLDSIRDTTQAIDEIDSVCQQQFSHAFGQINARFKESFVGLFGGGQGELRLIEEAESADAGVEIIAQPPGKKLQNVLLLSGGEKALTALALVIALFQFKPSPFCVLDEVDAPLDDANIDRFAGMIRTMSQDTQFIVVTHSKRTMETANQLYGVTMEEPGISKVVSVRLN